MNDILEFFDKSYCLQILQINLQFWPVDPNDKIWYRNIEKYDMESFSKLMQVDVNAKIKT